MSAVKNLVKNLNKYKYLYIMLIPGIVFFIIFHYAPMFGITIAFKDFKIMKGIGDSPWVGFKYFKQAFESPYFFQTVLNTLTESTTEVSHFCKWVMNAA